MLELSTRQSHIIFLKEKNAIKFVLTDGSILPLCLSRMAVISNATTLLYNRRITVTEFEKICDQAMKEKDLPVSNKKKREIFISN